MFRTLKRCSRSKKNIQISYCQHVVCICTYLYTERLDNIPIMNASKVHLFKTYRVLKWIGKLQIVFPIHCDSLYNQQKRATIRTFEPCSWSKILHKYNIWSLLEIRMVPTDHLFFDKKNSRNHFGHQNCLKFMSGCKWVMYQYKFFLLIRSYA